VTAERKRCIPLTPWGRISEEDETEKMERGKLLAEGAKGM